MITEVGLVIPSCSKTSFIYRKAGFSHICFETVILWMHWNRNIVSLQRQIVFSYLQRITYFVRLYQISGIRCDL